MLSFFTKEWKKSNVYKSIVSLIRKERCCTCCKVPLRLPLLTETERDKIDDIPEGLIFFSITEDIPQISTPEGWQSSTTEDRGEPELGLRLTYTPGNVPPFSLAQWNNFFDLPTNGGEFTSVSVTGDVVTLVGGTNITIKASLFRTSDKLVKIQDNINCVTSIAGGKVSGAFSACPNLTTVSLNGVTSVDWETFANSTSLIDVSLTSALTVGIDSFYKCTSIVTLVLPSLISCGNSAFSACTGLVTFTATVLNFAGDSCWSGCSSLSALNVPSLTVTGQKSWAGCSSLTNFSNSSLITAGIESWKNCSNLAGFSCVNCTTIGAGAFYNCSSLGTVDLRLCTALGNDVLNNNVFYGCASLTKITVPTALATINSGNPDGDITYANSTYGTIIVYV